MIKTLWNRVKSIGVYNEQTTKAQTQTILINELAFILFVSGLATFQINIWRSSDDYKWSLISTSIAVLIWVFNSRKEYDIAKHLIGFVYPIEVGFLMINTESNFAFTNLFLVNVLVSFIIYENRRILKICSITFILFVGLCTMIFITKFKPNYHIDLNPYNDLVIFIGAFVAIALLISIYQKNILSVTNKQKDLQFALGKKNIELERFAYVTSHDLKEPVRNIENLSKFIRGTINDKSCATRNNKMIEMIKESSERMSSLIDSILSYSKLEAKDLPVEKVELSEIINEFRISHINIMKELNASLVCEKLPVIVANRAFISLLFQNLIENGIKYNTSKQPLVEIESGYSDAGFTFLFKDNGIGIKDEFRSRVFEPFKRLHNNQSFKGSGLGLSICKKIVDMHGGEIWIEDNPSGGSIFQVNLPK